MSARSTLGPISLVNKSDFMLMQKTKIKMEIMRDSFPIVISGFESNSGP